MLNLFTRNLQKKNFVNSTIYWQERYAQNGGSGNGSLPFRTKYKQNLLNYIFNKYQISSVLDVGCGDGNLLSGLFLENYTGIDVSNDLIHNLSKEYIEYENYSFAVVENFKSLDDFDAVLSIDVIFHLVEDEDYISHMNLIFGQNAKYVVVRSSNHDKWGSGRNSHIRHRKFIDLVYEKFPNFEIVEEFKPRKKFFSISVSDFSPTWIFKNNSFLY